MHPDRTTRRDFLRQATGASAGLVLPHIISSAALGGAGRVAPSNRITLGCIGTGGMGTADMSLFLQLPEVQLVALCDVKKAARAARCRWPRPPVRGRVLRCTKIFASW